jgi:hypothetical protein
MGAERFTQSFHCNACKSRNWPLPRVRNETVMSRRRCILLGQSAGRRIPCMAKPLKCRLRLHNWEDRENPETHERYQVCLRCNAYRDRGNAAPGAGAAGVTGAGIG